MNNKPLAIIKNANIYFFKAGIILT